MIVTLTMNPTVDKSAKVNQVVSERKLRCHSPRLDPGGGGLNVSRAIKKLGGDSLAMYSCGGPNGQILQSLLDQEGIAHRAVAIKGWTRESFSVLEEATGLQYRFNLPGPELIPAEWQQCLDALSAIEPRPDYIVASGSLPPGVPADFYARVAKLAQQMGARLVVDTSGDALREAARAQVFLLKPNLRELSDLSGVPLDDEPSQETAALDLIEKGYCQGVVLSLGTSGVLFVTKAERERVRSPIVPIISKIGAGDSMVAGIVLGLARGQSLRQAVCLGVAAGAAAVMTPGTELCRREDTERLYDLLQSGSGGL